MTLRMTPPQSGTLEIDAFTDVVCPWCFIGTRRLEAVLRSGGEDAVVRHHPFILQPDAPPEGVDLHAVLRERYGTDLAAIFEGAEQAARASGIPLDLSKQARTYSTEKAHTLIRHAEAKGTQRAVVDALFEAYFLEARNVGDPAVLAEIATSYGFRAEEAERIVNDPAELAQTRADVAEASRMGVRGVPLFVFNGRLVLSGAQPEQIFRDAIGQAGREK